MKILVVIGDYLLENSSANLCHLSYLRGLVENGHDTTLICADSKGRPADPNMSIPRGIQYYSYQGLSLYEKLSIKYRRKDDVPHVDNSQEMTPKENTSLLKGAVRRMKSCVLHCYGPHGVYAAIVKTASRFSSSERFDCLVSLASPPASHLIAHNLIQSGRVKADSWIQIWEDPWTTDAYGFSNRKAVFREEKRLLAYADRVCYVSPITLENQKKLFPESANKMYWVPVPSYYEVEETGDTLSSHAALFGYFGDYHLPARDLRPFYHAAKTTGIDVNICGDSNLSLSATEKIRVFPRLPLSKLRPIEEKTGVLVFLCNKAGGQIPGKIYQYAASRKTILFILDGTEDERKTMKDFFEPFHRFVFCENKAESIERAIRAICNGELEAVQNEPLTQFKPKTIVQQLLSEGMK